MFDTLTLFLKQDYSQTSEALYALSELQEHSKTDTGEVWHTGKQGNLRVTVLSNGISTNGSLPKYFLGNNAESLTRTTTKHAIEKLSDTFHLPMKEASVSRIDVGQNFIVQEPIFTYLCQLGDIKYFERGAIKKKSGLLFTSGRNAISFYDKISDLKRHNEAIPPMFQGENVLRYERRWSGRVAKQFQCTKVTGSMLYEESFYTKCVEKWKDDFTLIHKRRLPTDEINMNGKKEFMLSLAFLGVQQYGEDYLIEAIKSGQKRGSITKKTASDLRIKLREITQAKSFGINGNDPIRELETKVSQVAQNIH